MQFRTLAAALLATAALAAAPSAGAATFISGQVGGFADVGLGDLGNGGSNSKSLNEPGQKQILLSAFVMSGASSALAFYASTGNWYSAVQGDIQLQWGWDLKAAGFGGQVTASTSRNLDLNWSYAFTALEDGEFRGTYEITSQGPEFGLGGLDFLGDWTTGSVGIGSGSFAVPLTGGQTYLMALNNTGEIAITPGVDQESAAFATIAWEIVYRDPPPPPPRVSEPATLALLGAGLLGLAAIRRRRA